jgi:uncharacterized membrane protein YcaP (DUF421 family)
MHWSDLLLQAGLALLYYVLLVVLMRLAGKRLAGQTTTLDLVVLISLGVVIQQALLGPGRLNAVVFVATVFVAHRAIAVASARSRVVRELVRGRPAVLIEDGKVRQRALEREGLSLADLEAGLRKLGYQDPKEIKIAVLEETGQISAIPLEPGGAGPVT